MLRECFEKLKVSNHQETVHSKAKSHPKTQGPVVQN